MKPEQPTNPKAMKIRDFVTYIVQNDANKDVERNPEEVHYGTSCLFWNILGSHLHYGWPEDPHTSLKRTEAKKQDTATKCYTSPFHI